MATKLMLACSFFVLFQCLVAAYFTSEMLDTLIRERHLPYGPNRQVHYIPEGDIYITNQHLRDMKNKHHLQIPGGRKFDVPDGKRPYNPNQRHPGLDNGTINRRHSMPYTMEERSLLSHPISRMLDTLLSSKHIHYAPNRQIHYIQDGDIYVTDEHLRGMQGHRFPDGQEPRFPDGQEPYFPGGQEPYFPGGQEPYFPGGQEPDFPDEEEPRFPDGQDYDVPGGQDYDVPGGQDYDVPGGQRPYIPNLPFPDFNKGTKRKQDYHMSYDEDEDMDYLDANEPW